MMDELLARQIEREGAEALLDIGVSIPLFRVRFPFFKKSMELRVTMKRPTLSGQIKLARTYLSMGVTTDELWKYSTEDQMRFIARHGKGLSEMIAITICRSYGKKKLLGWLTAWIVRHFMPVEYQIGALKRFISLLGTDPFLPIIRSAEMTNPLKPRLSRTQKRS